MKGKVITALSIFGITIFAFALITAGRYVLQLKTADQAAAQNDRNQLITKNKNILEEKLTNAANQIQASLPREEQGMRIYEAFATKKQLTTNTKTLNLTRSEAKEFFIENDRIIKNNIIKNTCNSNMMLPLLKDGAIFVANYFGNDDKLAYSIEVSIIDCR